MLAVACYVIGMVLPGTVFLVGGAIVESVFWFRLLRRRR